MTPENPARYLSQPSGAEAPIVCIGLSAGGIGPLQTVLNGIHAHYGMAFVVIPHISRDHPTALPELVSMWSKLPSTLAWTGLRVQPNHVYVIPPGKELWLDNGKFMVRPRPTTPGFSRVITVFLGSMANCRRSPGVAVILSGMDADGSAALHEFKARGGVVIVQEPESAECPDMPRSARRTGCVDYVLPPRAIAEKICQLGREASRVHGNRDTADEDFPASITPPQEQ